MPTDFKLTPDRDIELDPTGDIATVEDNENIKQQHVNAAFRAAARLNAELLNANAEEEFRVLLIEELSTIGYIDSMNIQVSASPPREMEVEIKTDVLDSAIVREVSV